MATVETKEKRDVRQDVTNRLIQAIENGTAPWQRPHDGGPRQAPINAVTGNPYTGGNHIWLSLVAPNQDPRWCTFAQAKEKGWQVKKGEHGVPIEVWKTYEKKTTMDMSERTPAERKALEKAGYQEGQEVTEDRRFAKVYTVFHASQIDGIPALEVDPSKTHDFDLHAVGEKLFDKHEKSAPIHFDSPGQAYYRPLSDDIHLPPKDQFLDAGHLYATAAHEIAHSTMHESRMDRKDGHQNYDNDKSARAREELRAEIASFMISEKTGIPHHPENHESYVSSWVSVLRNSKNEIYQAAREAEKIADYVIVQQKLLEVEMPEQKKTLTFDEMPIVLPDIVLESMVKDSPSYENDPGFVLSKEEAKDRRMNGIPRYVGEAEQPKGSDVTPPAAKAEEVSSATKVNQTFILTHRDDLQPRMNQEIFDDGETRSMQYVPTQKMSGILKDFGRTFVELDTEKHGLVIVDANRRIFDGRSDELREAMGKPVDISISSNGKNLFLAFEKDGQKKLMQDHFPAPAIPVDLLDLKLMSVNNPQKDKAVEGVLTHIHDSNVVEVDTGKGKVLVTGTEPSSAHQKEMHQRMGHRVHIEQSNGPLKVQSLEKEAKKEKGKGIGL